MGTQNDLFSQNPYQDIHVYTVYLILSFFVQNSELKIIQ